MRWMADDPPSAVVCPAGRTTAMTKTSGVDRLLLIGTAVIVTAGLAWLVVYPAAAGVAEVAAVFGFVVARLLWSRRQATAAPSSDTGPGPTALYVITPVFRAPTKSERRRTDRPRTPRRDRAHDRPDTGPFSHYVH